ncbi:hypothetical protein [Arthrobacter globiformis]|uniref:hypothetical protein n=1 Tax=Arthrobacter globiformis TaxID=1665 RepID=UPI0027D79347|nr:hypothetical protein [Arthrobacter globiformis]
MATATAAWIWVSAIPGSPFEASGGEVATAEGDTAPEVGRAVIGLAAAPLEFSNGEAPG